MSGMILGLDLAKSVFQVHAVDAEQPAALDRADVGNGRENTQIVLAAYSHQAQTAKNGVLLQLCKVGNVHGAHGDIVDDTMGMIWTCCSGPRIRAPE